MATYSKQLRQTQSKLFGKADVQAARQRHAGSVRHREGVLGCCGWLISDRRTFTTRCQGRERTALHQLGISGWVQPEAAITSPLWNQASKTTHNEVGWC